MSSTLVVPETIPQLGTATLPLSSTDLIMVSQSGGPARRTPLSALAAFASPPGGAPGQVQFNNGGTFGGVPFLTISGTTLTCSGVAQFAAGVEIGSPLGGIPPAGTLNAQQLLINGSPISGVGANRLIGDAIGTIAVGTIATTVVAIGGEAVSLGGPLTTGGSVTVSGADTLLLDLTGNTTLTLPTSGTVMTDWVLVGNAGTQTITQGATATIIAQGTALASADIWVGNAGGVAAAVAMSGDASIANTGAVTVSKIGGQAVTLAGPFTEVGAFPVTLTATGTTSVTLPTTGTLQTTALPSADIWVGNAGGVAAAVVMSGDATISNTGAVTVGKIGGEAVSLAGPLTISGAFPVNLTATGTTSLTLPVGPGTLLTNGSTLGYPNLPASADIQTIPFPLIGTPPSAQVFAIPLTQAGTLLANGGGGFAYTAGVNPTATQALTVETIHNGTVTTQGTISISTGGSVTPATFSAVAIAAGDSVAIKNQATADATFANWSVGLQFQKT